MAIESPRLQQLQAALTQGNRGVLAAFWAEVAATGAPLIEPAGDGNCLVTFLWRDPGHTQSVVVLEYSGGHDYSSLAVPLCGALAHLLKEA